MPLVVGPNGQLYSDWRAENAAVAATKAQTNRATPPLARPAQPVVTRAPTRAQFGAPSREGIDVAQGDMSRFLSDYTNPRGTSRFSDLLGAASTSLARGEQERVRLAAEGASRRGYVGGFSGESDRARRDSEVSRARIGFDAANQIATESAGLYDSSAGRFANLVTAYNQELGAGDRAYGGAVQDARDAQRMSVERFRTAQEEARQYDETTGEQRRQFDTTTGERRREFDIDEGNDQRQFDTTTSQRDREFRATHALDRDRLSAEREDRDISQALAMAKALGIDPRILLANPNLFRRGGGGSATGRRTTGGNAPASGGTRLSSSA